MAAPAHAPLTPFDSTGVERGPDGVKRYTDLQRSVVAMLRESVERAPDDEALVELGGRRLTYAELWDGALRVAGGLHALGIAPGDRTAVHLPNGADWVLAWFGSVLAGALPVAVNTRFAPGEVAYVVEDSGARHVFSAGEALPDGQAPELPSPEPGDVVSLMYTSGTTGSPKGAMLTHENLLANVENARRCIGIAAEDEGPAHRALICVPLFHATGLHSQLLVALRLGGTAVIQAAFAGPETLRALQEERISSFVGVPAMYHYLVHMDGFESAAVAGVRNAAYGGAPITPTLVHQLEAAWPNARLGNGFGQTESTSISTFLPHEHAAERAETVGLAAPVIDVCVGEPGAAVGEGELLLRGQTVCAGYWGKGEATAQTFVDGWLHTGDIGSIDEQGFVTLLDRTKDMVNRGGENVYSVEVENGLAGAPGVGEVAVLGVPDEMMGEKVGAVVVPLAEAELEPDAVIAHAREQLADFKVPQYLRVREEPLPRNAAGKVLKAQLRDEVEWGAPLR